MELDVVSGRELRREDVEAWSRLQDETGLVSPFLSPHWVQACVAVDGPDGRGAKVAILREGDMAIGFLPARTSRFTAQPVGAPMCDYQGLVAPPDVTPNPCALVRALGVGRLDFSSAPRDQAVFQPFLRGQAHAHVIDLSQGYDAYVAGRKVAGTDILQDTGKKRRKLEREQGAAVFTISRDQGAFDALLAWKRAQYRATGQTDIFDAGWTGDLLQSLFDRPDPAFGGALFTLNVGGALAAAHFALRRGDVLHAWFIGHDEGFSRYSPGVILICDLLKWAAGQGVREIDLGPGDYRFKQSLANVQRSMGHGYIGRPSPAALARAMAYQIRDTAEALPLGRFSALPGKAMRRLDLRRGLAR